MRHTEFRDFVDKVREQTDIVQIVGRHVSLDRHHKALCPFHKETTASFSVNPQGQYFYRFGCGVGGDVIQFLELREKKPFLEVVTELVKEPACRFQGLSPEISIGGIPALSRRA